eukprot:5689336-Prorocentrum_lima.AAC.1
MHARPCEVVCKELDARRGEGVGGEEGGGVKGEKGGGSTEVRERVVVLHVGGRTGSGSATSVLHGWVGGGRP